MPAVISTSMSLSGSHIRGGFEDVSLSDVRNLTLVSDNKEVISD